jgi:hypothetical protein
MAGYPGSDGYIQIGLIGNIYSAHRLAWLYIYGEWPTAVIDHKNWVRADNRIANLRDVPQSVNSKHRSQKKNPAYKRGK